MRVCVPLIPLVPASSKMLFCVWPVSGDRPRTAAGHYRGLTVALLAEPKALFVGWSPGEEGPPSVNRWWMVSHHVEFSNLTFLASLQIVFFFF